MDRIEPAVGLEAVDIELAAREEGGKIILMPVRPNQAEVTRQRPAEMGLNEQVAKDAIAWARET